MVVYGDGEMSSTEGVGETNSTDEDSSSTDEDSSSTDEDGSSTDEDSSSTDEDSSDTSTDGDTDEGSSDTSTMEPEPFDLSFSPIKQFDFSWAAVDGAEYYQLHESANVGEPFVQLGGDIVGESISIAMPLHLRVHASYQLRACNADGCSETESVDVVSNLAEAVGYFKASNTDPHDNFGATLALSGDGDTLAIAASGEDGSAAGIAGDQMDNSFTDAGAVYVFVRDGAVWSQQAYVKASNPDAGDCFGSDVALSNDGDTLVVGASCEDSGATGIAGDQTDDSRPNAGAAYVFVRNGGVWSQQTYVKASNTGEGDRFGGSVSLSDDGNTLAVGAYGEESHATGIDGDQTDNSLADAGAAYVFVRNDDVWSQQAYVKASNSGKDDGFGRTVELSGDGQTLAVSAIGEASNATGIDGDQTDDSCWNSGAVYVFSRNGSAWSQQAYVKASNTGSSDYFGFGVALSSDGNTLAVGAFGEDGGMLEDDPLNYVGAVYVYARNGGIWSQQAFVKASNPEADDQFGSVALSSDGDTLAVGARTEQSGAMGIDGDQADNSTFNSGAVYVFVRDGGDWSQRAYVKASNTGLYDEFGNVVALSNDGDTLAVGARYEQSSATGIGGDQTDNSLWGPGAVYLY